MRAARPARLFAAFTMAVVLVAAAGCSSSSSGSATKGTTKTEIGDAASVSSTTAPTTTTTAPTTTTTIPAPVGLDTPKAAAERLYSAWKAGDRNGALTVAEPAAVDGIFAAAPGNYSLYSGCDTAEFSDSGCLYRGDAGTIQVTMAKRGTLWVVITAFYAEA
jgi:hypothetical protein